MREQDLKPCPFCGGGGLRTILHRWRWVVDCIDCNIQGPSSHIDSRYMAAAKWNNRARVKCVHELAKEYTESTIADFETSTSTPESKSDE